MQGEVFGTNFSDYIDVFEVVEALRRRCFISFIWLQVHLERGCVPENCNLMFQLLGMYIVTNVHCYLLLHEPTYTVTCENGNLVMF